MSFLIFPPFDGHRVIERIPQTPEGSDRVVGVAAVKGVEVEHGIHQMAQGELEDAGLNLSVEVHGSSFRPRRTGLKRGMPSPKNQANRGRQIMPPLRRLRRGFFYSVNV